MHNLRERFDQARTKVYDMTLFVTAGHKLMGRDNQHMMTIIYDGNKTGTHDLHKGMCSGYRFRLAQQENCLAEYYPRAITEIPDHGCYETLSKAVASYGIIREDNPSPFNLNRHMVIDGATGKMQHTQIPRQLHGHSRRDRSARRVERCPDLAVGGKPVDVMIYQP